MTILSGHLYIAFHPDSDVGLIAEWQAALDSLREEGVIAAIHEKYDR